MGPSWTLEPVSPKQDVVQGSLVAQQSDAGHTDILASTALKAEGFKPDLP